jgi:hypothetical protein
MSMLIYTALFEYYLIPSVEAILFTCLSILAIIQINRIRLNRARLDKLPLSALFQFNKDRVVKYFSVSITLWNLLYLISRIKISIVQKSIEIFLKMVFGSISWFQYFLFTPMIIFFIITIIDSFWSTFLNTIENYKTPQAKLGEFYRIRWTDRFITIIFTLFPMLDLYGLNYISIKNFIPILRVFLDPYFKSCHLLSRYCPSLLFFCMAPLKRKLLRPRGSDSKQQSKRGAGINQQKTKRRVALLPKRRLLSWTFENTRRLRLKRFIRWNIGYVTGIWAIHRFYRIIVKLLTKKPHPFIKDLKTRRFIKERFSPWVSWFTFLLLSYGIFSSLQGKCPEFPILTKAAHFRSGRYRVLFKKEEKNNKQAKYTFLKFSIIFIIFFAYRLQGLFGSLLDPFFLLDPNYLTVIVK